MAQNPKTDSKGRLIPGVLITFEGGEGAGKSTAMNRLAEALSQQGYSVVKTREPGGSKLGDEIRRLLLNFESQAFIGVRAELLLFLAARAQHIEELIQPALEAGKVVLCDRFNDSTVAYQGIARGIGEDVTRQLCDLATGGIVPDLTIFFDVDPSIGLERTKRTEKENAIAGQIDRIEAEKLEFHNRVLGAFKNMAKQYPKRIRCVDASRSEDEVYWDIFEIVEQCLAKARFGFS